MESILPISFPLPLPGGFRKKSAREYAGPCPVCGGEDRFVLILDNRRRGGFRWFCRGCRAPEAGKAFDAIDLYRAMTPGATFPQACEALGVEIRTPARPSSARQERGGRLPDQKWRERAAAFLRHCQKWVNGGFDPDSAIVADFADLGVANGALFGWRGLLDETCVQAGIGFNSRMVFERREKWGLQGEGNIALPRGIVIAVARGGMPVAIAIRRMPGDSSIAKYGKYHELAGGAKLAFVIGEIGDRVLLCESALDGALAWQESGYRVAAVALMGCGAGAIDSYADSFLRQAKQVVISYDRDDAGREAAGKLRNLYKGARCVAIPGFKDLGEMELAYWRDERDESTLNVKRWLQLAFE